MPLRPIPPPLVPGLMRLFHISAITRDPTPDYYETLQVPANATPAEVKRSFYSLSKTHHPDRNPDDPEASKRFVKISEAYAVLGTPAKRQQYDRDFPRGSHRHGHAHGHTPKGSYHSSGPAGGRPASGLSRRRTQFHGPPPSFYRSGGWGAQGTKRRAASDGAAGGQASHGAAHEPPTNGGMGPGQSPLGHTDDVPHFDRDGHFRRQEKNENRRKKISQEHVSVDEASPGTLTNFLLVGGIMSFALLLPAIVFERLTRRQTSRAEKQQS